MQALLASTLSSLLRLQLPLTAVLLLFELTHDYFIIIPTLASVAISYWVASFPLASVLEPLSPLSRLFPSAPTSASISASQVDPLIASLTPSIPCPCAWRHSIPA